MQGLVEYLIDAGHFVYVSAHDFENNQVWKLKYSHNLRIIDKNDINSQEFDYILDFDNYIIQKSAYKINFNLGFSNNKFSITSLLEYEGNTAAICAETIILETLSDSLSVNICYFVLQITELFIDSIVYLLRFSNDSLVFDNQILSNKVISDLLNCENILHDLANYYNSLKSKEKFFFVQHIAEFQNKPFQYSSAKLEFNNKLMTLTVNDLELFTLYILALLNSRSNEIYSYDLSTSKIKNSFIVTDKVSKFIEVELLDSAECLLNKCNNNLYNITNNIFYYGTALNDYSIKPDVLLSYNGGLANDDYLIAIYYDDLNNELNIRYRKDLCFFEEIQCHFNNFLKNYKKFLKAEINFKNLLNLSSEYNNRILAEWGNNNDKVISSNKVVHELFQEQVIHTPNKVALIYEETKLTYIQLNEKANQLVAYITKTYFIKPDDLVVLCLDRSEHLIIAMLAVLKSGGAYIPLDPNYPDERIISVLLDSKPKLVITNEIYKRRFEKINKKILLKNNPIQKNAHIKILDIDNDIINRSLSKQLKVNPESQVINSNIAYVIYTSGTTGTPKGVIIEHQSLVNIITSISKKINFKKEDRILAVTTIAFDIAALEIFMPLLGGGELILTSQKDLVDTYKLVSIIQKLEVTILQATPSLWHLITQLLKEKKLGLRALCGGEPLTVTLAKAINKIVYKLWNVYGPTETTVWSTIQEMDPQDSIVSMGYPISNTKCYVLDKELNLLPLGSIGELYIGGIGLARGYLNKPDLTAEKFISNPFQVEEEKKLQKYTRIYQTGDFVRWLPDGNLEFMQRKDSQIKIRGYRVEIGEIEEKLSSYPEIERSVVLTWEQEDKASEGNKYIVGYYVSKIKLNEEDIINFLKQLLPEYMVPAMLIHIEYLPLNINNKLDVKALPEPKFTSNDNFLSPVLELEIQLYKIWDEILHLRSEKPNMRGNFFKLGGNSILAIRLVSRINNEFQSDIKIKDVFYTQTLEKLSYLVKESIGKFAYKRFLIGNLDKKNLFELFPLNNIQQAYYLGRTNNFELSNVSTHVYSEYKYLNLDTERLEKSFNNLINRHLALRTVFENGYQRYLKEVIYYKIVVYELSSEQELINIRNQFSHKIYDPEHYPLFDIIISKFNDHYILHISFDALIIDMSSFQILYDEWKKLYNNPDMSLPDLQVSHRDYIFQYEKVRRSELFKNAEKYWNAKLDDYNFEANIPLACNPLEIKNPRFVRLTKTIKREVWNKILNKTQEINISATSLILAIYARIICYWSGQDKLCVNVSLFNRLPLHPQINEVIGDFTVLELFNYNDSQSQTINKQLKRIHENLWSDIEHSLFDGIDFLRLIRNKKSIPNNQVVAPIVLTSMLGHNVLDLSLDESYKGVNYSISQTAQLWLDNKAYETEGGFVAEWDYVEQLFDKETIEKMHQSYCDMVEKLSFIEWDKEYFPLIGNYHKEEVIATSTQNIEELNSDTLIGRLEETYNKSYLFNDMAIFNACSEKKYKYEQLLYESNLLSRYILNYVKNYISVEPGYDIRGKAVGVLCEPGYYQIISALSIIKAGHCYLPLEEDWNIKRIDKILNLAKVQIILISKAKYKNKLIRETLPACCKLLIIEDILLEVYNNEELKTLSLPILNSDDTIFISVASEISSKRISITHREALNTIDAINNRFNINAEDKMLVLSNFGHALSLYNLFGILVIGGSLVFIEQDMVSNHKIWVDVINKYKITICNTSFHYVSLLINEITNNNVSSSLLRLYLLSGDLIPASLAYKIRHISPHARVMAIRNVLEDYSLSISYEIDNSTNESEVMLHLIKVHGQNMYVLNHNNEQSPDGVIGEIHIGVTNDKFSYVNDYIEHSKLGKLYKTNCLGKINKSGHIEFVTTVNNIINFNNNKINLELITSELLKLEGVKDAAVKIQKKNCKEYLIGYLIPKRLNISKGAIDEEAFKLEQYGILTGLSQNYKLIPDLDIAKYKLRKSYRNFVNKDIDADEVIRISNKIISEFKIKKNQSSLVLSKEGLTRILSSISAIKLENRILPKYRYPSGGSSYSIRCFVLIADQMDDINSGYYYYNPVEYALCKVKNSLNNSQQLDHEIHLVVNWPSIKPLYEDLSKKLVCLEVGHMASLLLEGLKYNGINYDFSIFLQDLDEDNTLIAKIKVACSSVEAVTSKLNISYLCKENNNQCFTDMTDKKTFNIGELDIFNKAMEFHPLLENSSMLISLEGKETIENLVLSGLYFQRISEALYKNDIGSCMLGFVPYEGALYSMVLGEVSEEEKNKPSSVKERLSLKDIINKKLPMYIAEYMRPYNYTVLNELPLDKHAQLDVNSLPLFMLKDEHTYIAPRNKLELQACKVWSDILSIPSDKISIRDDFFRLGANSLLAMQTVRRFNNEFEIDFKLKDLYKFRTIEEIFNNLLPTDESSLRNEGVI